MLTVRRLALLLFLGAAAMTASACIFDKGGDYNGGGRRDIGAKFGENQAPPTEDSGTGEDNTQDTGTSPLPDTGAGGG